MKLSVALVLLLSLALSCGFTIRLFAQDKTSIVTDDPFEQRVEVVALQDETIFDALAKLDQSHDLAISIEGILPVSGTISNPKFTATARRRSIADVLSWLCSLDPRYTWLRDGKTANIYPRKFQNDKNYFFNRLLPLLEFKDIRESSDAAIEVVHQLGDPEEHLFFMGIGGTQSFASPWTATFHDITVRQALNQIARQLGPTYGWQIGGHDGTRLILFHYKLGGHPDRDVPTQN
jgi:hypothetical protein